MKPRVQTLVGSWLQRLEGAVLMVTDARWRVINSFVQSLLFLYSSASTLVCELDHVVFEDHPYFMLFSLIDITRLEVTGF